MGMREIIIRVRIDTKKNIMGIFEDVTKAGFVPGSLDETIYMMGLYEHLANQQATKLKQKLKFNLPKKK